MQYQDFLVIPNDKLIDTDKAEFRCACGATGIKSVGHAKRSLKEHGFVYQCASCLKQKILKAKSITYDQAFLENAKAVDTTTRIIKTPDIVEFVCRCGQQGTRKWGDAVKTNSLYGFFYQCPACRRLNIQNRSNNQEWLTNLRTACQSDAHKERARQNGRRKLRTEEWLLSMGATDITTRVVMAQEYIELACHECQSTGMVRAGNADQSLKNKGYGYRCQNCKNNLLSEKAKLRTGDLNGFFGKTHSDESKKQMSESCSAAAAQIDPEIRIARAQAAYNASVDKFNGNPMSDTGIRHKHHEATHTEEFIARAKELGKKMAEEPDFAERQSAYSLDYWDDNREEKTAAQREVFLKRLTEYPDWADKRSKGLKEYLSDPDRVNDTWEKVKKTCLERFGVENWQHSSDAGLRAKTFSSKAELELLSWVRSLGLEADKYRHGGKELDIYISSKNIGIEYNGLYWHCEKNKDNKYHHDKTKYFKSQGIRVIHVFEHIWRDKQPQVKSFLSAALGKNEHRIGARECEIQQITTEEANFFANLYHIQGAAVSNKLSVGLFYDEELVAVATFGRHHRKSEVVVLNRFIGKYNWSVMGGLSKIMKFAINYFKKEIITWADNSISEGIGYLKAGWIVEEELPPDYFYTDFTNVCSKQSRKKGVVGTPVHITEHEHALHDGLFRIYDCGKTRMIFPYNEPLIKTP